MNRRQFLTTSGATALAASAPRAFAQPGSQDARLRAMLDGFFYERLDDSPEQATRLGLDTGARAALRGMMRAGEAARMFEDLKTALVSDKADEARAILREAPGLMLVDKREDGGYGEAVLVGVKRTQVGREDLGEHGDGAVHHVHGGSALLRLAGDPRQIDFARFRAIADKVGALFMVDMAHFAGLVAGGAHPSPFGHAHVVTTTTHKSLRGPRSGVILTNDEDLAKKFNTAVFPGLQGGPLVHVIAAKAVAFGEALRPEFKAYAHQIVSNARALAESLQEAGLGIVSGGTDNHLMLVDLTAKDVTGKAAEKGLDRAWLTCNKNGVPFDKRSPFVTSGIRLGTPAVTTRGFREDEFRTIGQLIAQVVDGMARNGDDGDGQVEQRVRDQVEALCARFPIYPEL